MPRENLNIDPVRGLSPAELALDSPFIGLGLGSPHPSVVPYDPDVSKEDLHTLLNILRGLVHSIEYSKTPDTHDRTNVQLGLRLSLIASLGEGIAYPKGMVTSQISLDQYRYSIDGNDPLSPVLEALNGRIDVIMTIAGDGFCRLSTEQRLLCMEALVVRTGVYRNVR